MKRSTMLCVLLGGTSLAMPALAQSITDAVPPQRQNLDDNGVDRATGIAAISGPTLSIGGLGLGGLSVASRSASKGSSSDDGGTVGGAGTNWGLVIYYLGGSNYSVGLGRTIEAFTLAGSTFTPVTASGSSLVRTGSSSNYVYTYTTGDGTRIVYDNHDQSDNETNVAGRATKISYLSGDAVTLKWNAATICTNDLDGCSGGTYMNRVRLQSVSSSRGYQLHYNYGANFTGASRALQSWNQMVSISAINTALDYCDPAAGSCATPNQTPAKMFFSSNSGAFPMQVTDPEGRVYVYTGDARTLSVQTPGHGSANIVYTLASDGTVTQMVRDGMTYGYAQAVTGTTRTVTVTDPLGYTSSTTADTAQYQLKTSTDARGFTTTNTWTSGLLTNTAFSDGRSIHYDYDGRGNVIATTAHSRSTTNPTYTTIQTTANYPTTCTVAATCNKPIWTKDAKGNQTDYEYYIDAGTNIGAIKTVTSPADANGVRPQVRYTYGPLQAQVKNSAGAPQSTGQPVWLLSMVSTCRSGTAGSCVGTDNETRTWYSSFSDNLLNTGVRTGPGGGTTTPTATVASTYDAAGNVLTVTDPNLNATRYVYNKDREMVGVLGADPDGVGTGNWAQAQRITYDLTSGWVSKVEQGTVPGQTDADWANFSSHREVDFQYDSAGRKVRQTVVAGTTKYAETEFSYDPDGRLDCSAQRMVPSTYGQTAKSACDLVSTSAPLDRINRYEYDGASHVTKAWRGYRANPLAVNDQYTYTSTGKVETIIDANGNRTGYVYDGFDRLYQTFYPNPTTAGVSSTTDFEQYGYDANDNLASRQLRNGRSITFGYDSLNRLTAQTSPHLMPNSDPSLTFGYDLLGHLISGSDDNSHLLSFSYDALGNKTGEAMVVGSVSSQYDAGGRRIRTSWGDVGLYVTYGYDHADHMTGIYENGSTQLVSFGYDDDGRRTSRTFNNGTSKSYSYDAVSRLHSISLNGTYFPNTITLDQYNPAGQIGTRTQSNDAFAYSQSVNVNRTYGPNGPNNTNGANGLNQYTSIAGAAQSYNVRGDMTSSGGINYQYDSRDQLVVSSASASSTYYYDPLGRLDTISPESLHLAYDGDRLLTELNYSGNTVARRYVYGPGIDEPLIWYEGSGTGDKRYLDSDERGSIVRITNASGTATSNLLYDEYGVPAITNAGRFQYTGQAWIPSLGMDYYKTRMRSPTLGRFMQTDPIGYADGTNWYNYVHSDPVNATDPTGLANIIVNAPVPCQNGCYTGAQDFLRDAQRNLDIERVGKNDEKAGNSPQNTNGDGDIVVNARRPNHRVIVPAVRIAPVTVCFGNQCATFPATPVPARTYKTRLFGTHYCGPGGGGPTVNGLDAACKAHDECYGAGGFSSMSNYDFSMSPRRTSALQGCNQALCNAAGSDTQDFGGGLVQAYFSAVPVGACKRE